MRKDLASRHDLRSRIVCLAARAADCCAQVRAQDDNVELQQRLELHERLTLLHCAFERIQSELSTVAPYIRRNLNQIIDLEWYRPISSYPGGPSKIHSYNNIDDAALWNTHRMAWIRLECAAVHHQVFPNAPDLPLPSMRAKHSRSVGELNAKMTGLVEDLCASVFYCLTYRAEGSREISCFEDIAGAKAYTLISPLAIAKECLDQQRVSTEQSKWISNVLAVMEEKLGVAEAWCWEEGNEMAARIEIERQLSFND